MQHYIGVKILLAEPMTRGDYNAYRGWTMPADENGEDPGYHVTYSDGYESWSPASEFEASYRPVHASKLETAFALRADLLSTAETACVRPQPMFQALAGRRYDDMLALIKAKKPVDEIADTFEVSPEYVAAEAVKLKTKRK